MQDKQLFEYAVIRVVPKVEREEFLNAGIVLYCKGKGFLQVRFDVNTERLCSFCGKIDISEIHEYLSAFESVCKGDPGSGTIGKLPVAERFRWLTATRSTIIQCSKVHPGMCDDPAEMLQQLYDKLVV